MQYKNSFEYLYFFRWYLRDIFIQIFMLNKYEIVSLLQCGIVWLQNKISKSSRMNRPQLADDSHYLKDKMMLGSNNISNRLFYKKSKLEKIADKLTHNHYECRYG